LLDVFSSQGNAEGFTNERGALDTDLDDDIDDTTGSVSSSTIESVTTSTTGISRNTHSTASIATALNDTVTNPTSSNKREYETPITSNTQKPDYNGADIIY